MAIDFNVSPYYDDYFATGGGLENNYYKVLFRPGRALQARELTTAQTILQNQISTLGRTLFQEGGRTEGSEKHLLNPLDYVILNTNLTNGTEIQKTSDGDAFLNFKVGDVIKGSTSKVTASVQFVSPAEAGVDPNKIFVKYLTANTYTTNTELGISETLRTFSYGESLYHANTTPSSTNELGVISTSNTAIGIASGITVDEGTIFTKESFVKTGKQTIILDKSTNLTNARIGYVITDKIITSTEDIALNDNAQGYPNYASPGADRHKITLQLCSLGYATDWIDTEVSSWVEGVRYHKNRKIKLTGTSEVFICVKSHYSTTSNKPVTLTDNTYWEQAINFVEIARTKNGEFIGEELISGDPNSEVIKIVEAKNSIIYGDFTVKPFGLTIKENDITGVLLSNKDVTKANVNQLLVSIDSGHVFKDGAEVITQLPENFIADKTRTQDHVKLVSNYCPEVNYGNYILVDNLNGYFDIGSHETVTFYNLPTGSPYWNNTENIVGTAKIRYFDLHSGRKSETANTESLLYPKYRAYLYNFNGVKSGQTRSIAGSFGHADSVVSFTTKNTVDSNGLISISTSNVYGHLYESGIDNKTLFPLAPGYIQYVYPTNSTGGPVFYTLKDFDAQLVRTSKTIGGLPRNVFELRNASSNTLFTEASLGSELGNGLVDPANETDIAEANYTMYNMSNTEIEMSTWPTTIGQGEIIPEDGICGESNSEYKWSSGNLIIYFESANTSVDIISNIKFRVKVGVTDVPADTKTFIPYTSAKVSSTANTTNQGYDSREISLFESDIYSLDAVYMSGTANVEASLPVAYISPYAGTELIEGETVYETDTNGNRTGNICKLVRNTSNTSANTWTVIGSDSASFTMNNYVIGETSKGTGIINANTIINSGAYDITGRYSLDSGQRDNYYDWGKIKLKAGKLPPTSPIIIVYSKFDTSYGVENEKTFYTVGSYGGFSSNTEVGWFGNSNSGQKRLSYSELPVYNSTKLGNVKLRDYIDFRPLRHANTTVTSNTSLSVGTFADINNITDNWLDPSIKIINPSPIGSDLFKIDYSHFLSRKDTVVLNKNKKFELVRGIPGSSSEPVLSDGALILWKLYFPPYLDNNNLIEKSFVENRGYTMKDIGNLDTRLSSLEKTVQLNIDELKALAQREPSLSSLYLGLERFKNGILLDNFDGHGVGDVQDHDYRCSVEPDARILRAPFESQILDINKVISSSDVTYHPVHSRTYINDLGQTVNSENGIVTLNYEHVSFIEQLNFTSSTSVTPYNTTVFIGKMLLSPDSDNWFDTETLPDINIDLTGNTDAWNALTSPVNERFVIALSTTPLYKLGSQVTSSEGGTATVSEIEGNNVVLINYEGAFLNGGTLTGTKNDGSPFSATMGENWVRGGATGFGTQFGDWQTIWTGTNQSVDVSQTSTSRSVSVSQSVRYTGYQNYSTTQSATSTQSGTVTTTRTTTNVNNTLARTGTRNVLSATTISTNLGEKIVDVSIVPYIRTKDVLFDANGLKPFTKHYPYFNGVDVSAHCSPRTLSGSIWNLEEYGKELVSDANGEIKGIFKIPGGVFATGERKFRLIDSTTSDIGGASTFAEAAYTASGLHQTKVNQIVSTRVPKIEHRTIIDERKTSSSTTTSSASTAWGTITPLPEVVVQTYPPDPCAGAGCPCEPCGCGGCPPPQPAPANIVIKAIDGKAVTINSTSTSPNNTGAIGATVVTTKTGTIGTPLSTSVTLQNTGGTAKTFQVQQVQAPTAGIISGTNSAMTINGGTYTPGSLGSTYGSTFITLQPGQSTNVVVRTAGTTGTYALAVVGDQTTPNQYVSIRQTCNSPAATDPLAQSFFVEKSESEDGVFLTAIDVFVSAKPILNILPLSLEIRSTINGYPSQYVVPDSSVTYNYRDTVSSASHNGVNTLTVNTTEDHKLLNGQYVTLSNDPNYSGSYPIRLVTSGGVINRKRFEIVVNFDAVNNAQPVDLYFSKINISTSSNNWIPTKFVFEYPIYLEGGEYTFVLKSDTEEYEVYMAEMGKNSLIDGKTISRQPYIGSMFKSQNSSTWTPTQEADLAFKIWRAKFDTSVYGDITFTQDDLSFDKLAGVSTTLSTAFNLKYNLLNFQNKGLDIHKTNINWYLKTTNEAGVLDSDWSTLSPSSDVEFLNTRKAIKGSESIKVRATFNTSNDYVSPFIDLLNQRAIIVENIINNTSDKETNSSGGSSQAKYISRSVILDEGMDAIDLRVNIMGSRTRYENSTSEIKAYMKLISSTDESSFHDRFWYPMELISDPGYSSSANDFKKYTYRPIKNTWYVQTTDGEIVTYYTGDGRKFSGSEIEYNESDIPTFIDAYETILEHVSYDSDNESITYTKYDGVAYPSQSELVSYTDFKQYAVKLVMLTSNKGTIPLIQNLQALALT